LNREYLIDSLFVQTLEAYLGNQHSGELDVVLLENRTNPPSVIFATSSEARSISSEDADLIAPFLRGAPLRSFGLDPRTGIPPERMFQGPEDGGRGQQRSLREWSIIELRIRHRAGSLEAAVRQNRMINFVIGSGILLLLLAGVAFILVNSKRAERLARQQIEFVAGVSHELRTPLAVLQSVGDNLADGVVTDGTKARSYGKIVRTEVQRLHTMVENALAYAGITAGKYAREMHDVDLHDVVRKACQSSQALLEERDVRLDVTLPDDFPHIIGDAPALQSVIENLLSNAVKYSPAEPWIAIDGTYDAAAGRVKIAVTDHGMGIARQEIAHLFEPFFRGKDAIGMQIRGSGLGLNLVRHIVERHGGSVKVESMPGKGSTFTVLLPAIAHEQGKQAT
jgi:signal transduction histidine kinase